MPRPFLTAQGRNLALITWDIDPARLTFLPKGLEPDTLHNQAFVSLVAFDFLDCRVKGIAIPGCTNFPEINLRTYVRETTGQRRRGVVFIREFVPSRLTALVAKLIYNEPYQRAPMHATSTPTPTGLTIIHTLGPIRKRTHHLAVTATGPLHTPAPDTLEHHLKEHAWGFGTNHRGQTLAYHVDHPTWRIHHTATPTLNLDFAQLYGPQWSDLTTRPPTHTMLAEGSAVAVYPHGPI